MYTGLWEMVLALRKKILIICSLLLTNERILIVSFTNERILIVSFYLKKTFYICTSMYQYNPHSKVQMLFKLTTQHFTFLNYILRYLLTFTIQTKCNLTGKQNIYAL